MGTTASTAQQTVSVAHPFESVHGNEMADNRRSMSINSFQTVNIHNNKAKSIITNKVAPVVITYNCREEFQIHDDLLKTNYTVGRISDTMPEHYLVQGKYFMVQDVYSKADVLNTIGSYGAPNFRQAKGNYPLFGMGQPSLSGFKQVLQRLQTHGYKDVIFFCVREEPVVFLHLENDFIPYTPRRKENLHENLHGLGKDVKVENLELTIRKELYDFAQLNENVYYVYNDIEHFKNEPQHITISCEEDIHVTEEVYKRPVFTMPSYRYHRLPLPTEGAPLEGQFDTFVNILRESPNLLLSRDTSKPLPALVFSCQVGVGRTNLGMILGTLVMYHQKGAPEKQKLAENASTLPKAHFQIIQNFINLVPKGQQILEEVDSAITLCSEMHDIKEAIYEEKKKLEGIGEDYRVQGSSTKEYFLQRTLQSLERYFYLIAFNYYLHEQYPLAFALNFSKWMCSHPWIYRLLASMNLSELSVPVDLVTKGTRVLVSDEYLAPDVLSTVKEMKVANFRRVPKMSVYGMAQPNSEATGFVVGYLTDEKRKHSHILWVNLQEEVVLEGNGQVYTPREPGCLEQQIIGPASSQDQIEELETATKEEILKSQKWLEVSLEQEKQMKMFKTCLTVQEIFNQHKTSCQGLVYRRIPVSDCCAPREQDFDRLMEAMKATLAEDSRAAFVFNCHNGKGRTTTAMVIAALTLWHFNGFPEMNDDEIVSVPYAKYTKGEFEVVMQLVRLLPEGHRMKKEVDAALDAVSETMTPMHYHLREIIIYTYRQIKTAKCEKEMQLLQLQSLQYLERYVYLILFNTYLHLEKKDSWQRPFSIWMYEVATRAGVYEILNELGFSEFENPKDTQPARLRYRWQQQNLHTLPFRGEFI
ncbi:paladin-like [Polyodon spathula]|nr:paladin-like [Polyodon spathula]XP_041124636.1 paladin-like [Polyodon spathula]